MKNKKLTTAILVLFVMIMILGYINSKNIGSKVQDEGNIAFVVGEDSVTLTFEEITSLKNLDFRATEDTSTSGPTPRKYKGVLLREAMNEAGMDNETIKGFKKVTVTGLDGYIIALGTDEVLAKKNIYLAFEKDGKPLGTMKKGGSGPFQMIATADMFAQRWCKYVIEVRLE